MLQLKYCGLVVYTCKQFKYNLLLYFDAKNLSVEIFVEKFVHINVGNFLKYDYDCQCDANLRKRNTLLIIVANNTMFVAVNSFSVV